MSSKYWFADLSDELLDRGILASAGRKHSSDAQLLAFIAEYDLRQRHVALGYESLGAFCVQALHLTPDSAYKRMQAARVAREFPSLFPALADGRLNLTAVNLLAPRLTAENADALIAAATHKSKAEIKEWLAERYPKKQASRMSLLSAANQPSAGSAQGGKEGHTQLAPAQIEREHTQLAPAQVEGEQTKLAPAQVEEVDCWARVTPLSGDRYSVSLTIDRATHELWRHNQSLLSHQVPSGNLAEVLRRALVESARQFEKRKFRSSRKARRAGCRKPGSRHVPKHVRDAVWRRDGGQCTFVGDTGHRCGSRTRLEYDHIVPVAHGGEATVDNLRLRCRVHNQFEADRAFGADFMRHKREQARAVTDARPGRVPAPAGDSPRSETGGGPRAADNDSAQATPHPGATALPVFAADPSPSNEQKTSASHESTPRDWLGEARTRAAAAGIVLNRPEPDVESVLRHLGVRADDARRAAKLCETIPDAPLEERLRVALKFLYAKPSPARVAERHGTAA